MSVLGQEGRKINKSVETGRAGRKVRLWGQEDRMRIENVGARGQEEKWEFRDKRQERK